MSAGQLSDEDREWLEHSCAESGVPVVVADPRVILDAADRLRAMRRPPDETRARGAPSGRLAGLDAERVATGSEPVPAGEAPQPKHKS